jgi:hypothetical protein
MIQHIIYADTPDEVRLAILAEVRRRFEKTSDDRQPPSAVMKELFDLADFLEATEVRSTLEEPLPSHIRMPSLT